MSDYTPTTDEVRDEYVNHWNPCHISEFDRWLAAHDEAIRADEREKAKAVIHSLMRDPAVKGNKARIDVLIQVFADIDEAARRDGNDE